MRNAITAAGLALLLGAGAANAQSYSIVDNFGASVFRYGEGTAGTTFQAFTQSQGTAPTCSTTCVLSNGGFPYIQKVGNTPVTGEISVAPGAVDGHPNNGLVGTDLIVLFTADTAGIYDVSGSFTRDNNTAQGSGIVGSVFSQLSGGLATFLFQQPLLAATGNPSISFAVSATLAVGDTIGFAINNNGGEFSFDSTGLAATITNRTAAAVPGPLAGAGLIPLLGLAGAMVARRRRAKLAA